MVLTVNVPALIVVPPVNTFGPESVVVPVPFMITAAEPPMVADTV